MTIDEFLSMPRGMKFEEYEKLLEKKKRVINKLRKLSDEIYDEEDSLLVLQNDNDERGRILYNKHLEKKQLCEDKKLKAQAELNIILHKLSQ